MVVVMAPSYRLQCLPQRAVVCTTHDKRHLVGVVTGTEDDAPVWILHLHTEEEERDCCCCYDFASWDCEEPVRQAWLTDSPNMVHNTVVVAVDKVDSTCGVFAK